MKTDCLIINPSALSQIYQALSNELTAIEPPIWAALLANGLRAKNKSVEILDCEGLGLNIPAAVSAAGSFDPKLTVIVVYGQQPSASTQNMFAASILCSALKETYPERKILLVGGHVSALPERTILEERADFVCKGEGLETILGLLEMNGWDDFKTIPGLWWKENGRPAHGPPSINISQDRLPIDLPGMAFDLLPMKNYRAHNWHCFEHIKERQPYASVYTSLGCPFRCSFCCIGAPFGGAGFRYWNPEFMLRQFDDLANIYGVKNIKIADEMFVLNKSHFLKLCHFLAERNYGFNIWAYARIDTVKPEYLTALKKAGVNWLALGIESGSKHVRDGMSKGRFDGHDIAAVVRQIKEAGINVIGNYIFGLPDDTFETMQETLDLALDLNCEMANFYSAMAYPGSKLYEMAIEKGWELPSSWLGYSQHAYECVPLRTEKLSAAEVLGFRDNAFHKYFEDVAYLNLIKCKFGDDTLEHVKNMAKYRLPRKILELRALKPKEIPEEPFPL